MRTDQYWPKEREDELRRLWTEGLSAGDCGRALGISRNAALGKAIRLGLPRHERKTAAKPRQRKPRPDFRAHWHPTRPPESKAPQTHRLSGAVWVPLDGAGPVGLLDLEPGMCKWPVSDGKPFLFCGKATPEGKSYCAHHHALAYAQVPARAA